MKTKKKKRRLKKEVVWFLHGLFFLTVAVIMGRRVFAAPVTTEYVIECGAPLPSPQVFFAQETPDAAYASPEEIADYLERTGKETSSEVDTAVLGAHRVFLRHDGRTYTALLMVEDTTAPVIEGLDDHTVEVGETVSYRRGVSVTDNHDDSIDLVVDTSGVDLTTPGDYVVTYHAADLAGNETSASRILHVVAPAEKEVTQEALTEEERILYAHADEVLSEITTEEMSRLEKARAIYLWVHDIEYIHIYEEQTDAENALQGFTERTGDCHVYEATARVLLSRIGIETLTVSNIEPAVAHAWNLINLGEGWRHFDATRRYEDADLFYLTTDELMAYSSTHGYTHLFDRMLYPAAE